MNTMKPGTDDATVMTRRGLLERCGQATAGAIVAGSGAGVAWAAGAPRPEPRGRYQQSIARWCVEKHWDLERTCRVARELGCTSVELVPPGQWGTLEEHGLVCALAGSHGFEKGMNNPEYHPECIAKLRAAIDACAAHRFPNVITFTGFREDIPDDVGMANCVRGYKQIVGHAEKQGVTLCLEMLNSRVSEEMKGHPGYQGDRTEYVVEIIRKVGSPRLKLLFDVYHVQIMDGDLISRIRQHREHIAHVHVAGCPGRGEIDETQEIYFPAVMRALADIGYAGYVGQEFVPTGDPFAALKQAVEICRV